VNLFTQKPVACCICKKNISHKHKPKTEWQIQGPLCGDCYVDQMTKFYELSRRQKCVVCKTEKDVPDMWEPRYQWEMKGLLCRTCFDKKDEEYKKLKTFCAICGKKLGMIRYNPKRKWAVYGQLCRECWDSQKAKLG
jgi:hypothetical protein